MPSRCPLCASIGGPATSPMAKMPFAVVSMRSLILTKPRSVS